MKDSLQLVLKLVSLYRQVSSDHIQYVEGCQIRPSAHVAHVAHVYTSVTGTTSSALVWIENNAISSSLDSECHVECEKAEDENSNKDQSIIAK